MQKLNLPPTSLKLRTEGESLFVFDIIRKKEILLTSEEWVRQHFIHLFIDHLGYPKSMIRVESGLKYFKSEKRSDLLVYGPDGNPFLIVECKAPDLKINRETVNQVSVYNKILSASYLAVTNGLSHFIWKMESGAYIPLNEFPKYPK